MGINCFHYLVILARLLIELNAKIQEYKLKNILFVLTTAILKLVLQLLILLHFAVFGREKGLSNFFVYD
jgi:hypothetical protein